MATNALGVGIDLPDVRTVVHAGRPARLRDYAQESGRAGRDGHRSDAIIVCRREPPRPRQPPQSAERGAGAVVEPAGEAGATAASGGAVGSPIVDLERAEVYEFVEGRGCRRVILDRVMDGRTDRVGCEDHEVQCDGCDKEPGAEEPDAEEPGAEEPSAEELGAEDPWPDSEPELEPTLAPGPGSGPNRTAIDIATSNQHQQVEAEPIQIQWVFEASRRAAQGVVVEARDRIRAEAQETHELERFLDTWSVGCVTCRAFQRTTEQHSRQDCPLDADWLDAVAIRAEGFWQDIWGRRAFEPYSGCFDCGVPQALCGRWRACEDDTGQFERVARARCQYKGLLVRVLAALTLRPGSRAMPLLRELMREAEIELKNVEQRSRWLGTRIMWGGLESNRLCYIFYRLCKVEEEEEDEEKEEE